MVDIMGDNEFIDYSSDIEKDKKRIKRAHRLALISFILGPVFALIAIFIINRVSDNYRDNNINKVKKLALLSLLLWVIGFNIFRRVTAKKEIVTNSEVKTETVDNSKNDKIIEKPQFDFNTMYIGDKEVHLDDTPEKIIRQLEINNINLNSKVKAKDVKVVSIEINNGPILSIGFSNDSNLSEQLRNCLVNYIAIDASNISDQAIIKDYITFDLFSGFNQDSVYSDISDILGEYTEKFDGPNEYYTNYTWKLNNKALNVTINSNGISYIQMSKEDN